MWFGSPWWWQLYQHVLALVFKVLSAAVVDLLFGFVWVEAKSSWSVWTVAEAQCVQHWPSATDTAEALCLQFRNPAGFSTESGRRDVLAAPQHSACVWPPQKCSSWSPVPGQRCARAAVGWWAGWRSWIWPPWPRTQPTEAFLSASPPPYNQGSCTRKAWLIFFCVLNYHWVTSQAETNTTYYVSVAWH